MDLYLRGHAGDPLRVDRVGRDPILVDRPRVTLGITAQPAVIEQLGERRELRGLGLLARILWCHPKSTVGTREVDPPAVPAPVKESYRQLLRSLLDSKCPAAGEPLAELTFSADALSVLHDFSRELEPRMGEGGDLEPMADWVAKLAGAVGRIAGLLHIAIHGGAGSGTIEAQTVRASINIGRYMLAHAQKVLGHMGGSDPALFDAKTILGYVQRRKVTSISRRDLHQALRKGYEGRFRQADALDAPLAVLVERGWVRLREVRGGDSKGRTSVVIDVNPNGVPQAQKPQKPQKVSVEPEVATPEGAIEPIEAFEPPHHVIEIACTMTADSTTVAQMTVTDPFLRATEEAARRHGLDRFDPDSPEGRKAYNDYLCELV